MTPLSEVAAALAALPLQQLAHFTPARNLPHILDDGELRSVADMSDDVRACYAATDRQRLDGYLDRICCSLQYPNGYYFDHARKSVAFRNYPDWVCLLLDPAIASADGTLFCPRNAASNAPKLPGLAGLNACYQPAVVGQGGQRRQRGIHHDPACPTDVQAEVLVPGPIPTSAIHGIVFPSEPAAIEEVARLERLGLEIPSSVDTFIGPGFFDKLAIARAVRTGHRLTLTEWHVTPA